MTLFMVGDPDQLLYRFSSAKPEILTEEIDAFYPDIRTVKLETNYRSTSEIIDRCRQLITNNYSDAGGPYDQAFFKNVKPRPDAPDGEPIDYTLYADVFAEGQALADNITEQIASGRAPGDFFVGARTRAQLGYLEGYLVRAKIPFINIAGGSFWGAKHVADVVAYVKLAFDESNSDAFQRVFNIGSNWSTYPWGNKKGEYCTHRFLGRAFIDACQDYETKQPSLKWVNRAASQKRSYRPGVNDLLDLIQELQSEMANAKDAGQVVQAVLDHCYIKYLKHEEGITDNDESENGKLEDLQTIVDIAAQFEHVEDFITYVDEMVKAAEAAKDKAWDDYVVLSTVHRLKGLERPVVYGVGICESDDLMADAKHTCGLLPHTFSKVPPPQNGVLPGGGMARMEDERCIMFVLVSRAKDECHLSGCAQYRGKKMGPSRFVAELGI
jgi:DNA helicase II / ATP-dependent DNA helicase PcrA